MPADHWPRLRRGARAGGTPEPRRCAAITSSARTRNANSVENSSPTPAPSLTTHRTVNATGTSDPTSPRAKTRSAARHEQPPVSADAATRTAANTRPSARFCLTSRAVAPDAPASSAHPARVGAGGAADREVARSAAPHATSTSGAASSSASTSSAPSSGEQLSAAATTAAHRAPRPPATIRPTQTAARTSATTSSSASTRAGDTPPREAATFQNSISTGGRSTHSRPYSPVPPRPQPRPPAADRPRRDRPVRRGTARAAPPRAAPPRRWSRRVSALAGSTRRRR